MRRAFTILELLAATALTALLMVVALHVIGSLGSSRAAMARHHDAGAWRADLLDTLRHDLTNASAASFRQDRMILTSHGALDPATLSHVHKPVTVIYGLATIDGRHWLVRSQLPRDGASSGPGWSELLCPDVTAFSVRPAGGALFAPIESAQDAAVNESIPPIATVSIDGVEGKVMNETLVLK